jgi:bacteriorhodopsin
MQSFESNLHWLYAIVMFSSALAFIIMSRRPAQVPSYKYVIHIFVVVWSGLAYSAIALGQGKIQMGGEEVVYARYLDWVVTTPLLLLSLNLTGKYTISLEGTITGALLGSQVIMILTGLFAELSLSQDAKWFWYVAGCIALVLVLWIFWGPLFKKAVAQGAAIKEVYRKSATFLTIQWLAYPMVWMLGKPGLNIIDATTTTVLFIILPIISKAGFGFFNLLLLRNLPEEVKHRAFEPGKKHFITAER